MSSALSTQFLRKEQIFHVVCSLLLFMYMIKTVRASPTASKRMTITVPDGSTNHGDPSLLCTVPGSWSTIATFFLGNFAAHAATLKTYPGESPVGIARAILYALFFPTAGVVRGLNAIFRRASFEKTDLRAAARAGALCTVVRSYKWRPEGFQTESEDNYSVERGGTFLNYALGPDEKSRWDVREGAWMKELPRFWPRPVPLRDNVQGVRHILRKLFSTDRKIHGSCVLPTSGPYAHYYTLAFVPRNARVESMPAKDTTKDAVPITLSSSYSLVKAGIALLQAVYASATLWKAAGTQVDYYGYAAFGLTVAPYVIMSLVNLFGNLLTPDYPTLYLVESEALLEARKHDAIIDGTVGRLISVERAEYKQLVTVKHPLPGKTLLPHQRTQPPFDAPAPPQNTDSLALVASPFDPISGVFTTSTPSGLVVFTYYPFERVDEVPTTEITELSPRSPHQRLRQRWKDRHHKPSGHWFFDPCNRAEIGIPWYSYLFFVVTTTFVGSLSLIVVGVLSKFRRRDSTHAQRVWTLCWLVFGMTVGTVAAFYSAMLEYRDRKGEGLRSWQKLCWLAVGLVFFVAPAVGGFIIVGHELYEWGSCVTLY